MTDDADWMRKEHRIIERSKIRSQLSLVLVAAVQSEKLTLQLFIK